jgi:hypothetical protein
MLVDAIPPIRHGVGRPRRRSLKLKGDKAYDSEQIRREFRRGHKAPSEQEEKT